MTCHIEIAVARYPHDPWLEKVCADMPKHPRVKYPEEEVTE